MDECIHAFSAFSDSLHKLLDENKTNNHEDLDWLRDQLGSISDRMYSNRRAPVPTRTILTPTYKSSSVDVLTPSYKGSGYCNDSMGVTALDHRPICRLASKSIVKDPHVAKRFASELKYRTDHSTIVMVSRPKDTGNSQWRPELSSRYLPSAQSFSRICVTPNTPPMKDFDIKITKVSTHGYPLPAYPPPSLTTIKPKEEPINNTNSDTSGFEDSRMGQFSSLLNKRSVFPSQLSADDSDSDFEGRSPSLLANNTPWNEIQPWSENESQTKVHHDEDGRDRSDYDDMETGKCTEKKKRIRFTSDSSMDLELPKRNRNQSTQGNVNWSEWEAENQPEKEGNNLELQIETESEQENRSQSEQENEPMMQNENQSEEEETRIGSDIEHEFWSNSNEDIEQQMKRPHFFPKSFPSKTAMKDDLPLMYNCCGCGKNIYRSVDMICFNARLNVIICELCFKSLTKGKFIIDSEGHEIFCTMCGDGGLLVLCDTCERSICRDCVKRFIGQEGLKEILEDDDVKWSCFGCDHKPIRNHQIYCQQYKEAKEMDEMVGRKRRATINMAEPPFTPLPKKQKRKNKQHSNSVKKEGDRRDDNSSLPPITRGSPHNRLVSPSSKSRNSLNKGYSPNTRSSTDMYRNERSLSNTKRAYKTRRSPFKSTPSSKSMSFKIHVHDSDSSVTETGSEDGVSSSDDGGRNDRLGLKGGAPTVLEGINLLPTTRRPPQRGSTAVCCRHGQEEFVDSDHESSEESGEDSSDDDCGRGQNIVMTTTAAGDDEEGVVSEHDIKEDESSGVDLIISDVVDNEEGVVSSESDDEPVATEQEVDIERGGVSGDDEVGVICKDNELSDKASGDEVGVSNNNPDNLAISDDEVGIENDVGLSMSDNEVGVANQISSNIESDSDDTVKDVPMQEEEEESDPEPMVLRPLHDVNGDDTPLALLDGILSSSDIDSDDVSLSDSDYLDELKKDCSNKQVDEGLVGGGRKPKQLLSDSNSSSTSSSTSTGSNVVGEGSSGDSDGDQQKRKKVSLKRNKKSWLMNRAEYGIEMDSEEGKDNEKDENGSVGGDRQEEVEGVSNDDKEKRTKKKKKSNKKVRKSSFYCYSDDDDFNSPIERTARKKERRPSIKSTTNDSTRSSKPKKKQNKYRDFLSSDEADNDVFAATVMSSSDDDNGMFKPLHHRSTSDSNRQPSETIFHLQSISSDDDSDDSFDKPPPKKKKKKKALLLSSSSSRTGSLNNSIISGNSSDDFKDSQGFTPRNIVKASIKKQKKMKRTWFNSDSDESIYSNRSSVSSSKQQKEEPSTPVKKEGSSSSDVEIISTPGKRKNIRKLLSNSKLTSVTREAQKAEKERRERLKQRNKSTTIDDDLSGAVSKHIVLDNNNENAVEVRKELVPKILPHQIKGIKFLYDSCCEDLQRLNNEPGSGAILAHCMGLGKTLQVIAFIDALLLHQSDTGIKKVLVLSPVNTLLNWLDEWNKWVPVGLRKYRVTAMNEKSNKTRINMLERWHLMGGVMIVGYTMFRTLTSTKSLKRKSDQMSAQKALCDPGADIVVCDEGHVLKQEKSCLSVAVSKVKTMRRIVLTGTPLQNNLMEYYTMCSFVKPDLLGTVKEFKNQFENPIRNGQHSDSRPMDVRIMKQRAHILHQLLKGCIDRRDYRILAEALPPKHEYVVAIRMTPIQDQLIMRYLEKGSGYHTSSDLFSTFSNLLKVWNHPRVLELDRDRKEEREERKQLDNFIDDDDDLNGFVVYDSNSDVEIIEPKREKEKKASSEEKSNSRSPSPPWYQDLLPDNCSTMIDLSGKVMFLLELLKEVEKVDEKILVFSQSLLVLDMIEEMLQLPECGSMLEGVNYFRLDGSTKVDDRRNLMKRFNRKSNQLRLFLISTRAGSLGINLIGANRVVIFDACWNPTHDLQSIFRTYRFGQTKPVFVYRLLAKGTMEEKIYDRQVTKQSLSMRVIDEKQIGRHFSFSQLQELFVYTPPPPPPDTPPSEPYESPESDIIFCNLLDKLRPNCIVGYHTHDSLLEHIYDEELSEEEQKLAWENYNMQKEMDSREYNMSLQLQQHKAALQSSGVGTGTSIGIGTGPAGPSSSGMGMGTQLSNGAPPTLAPSFITSTNIVQHIKSVLDVAKQVRGLLVLRNQLKNVVLDPKNAAGRQRYITTCKTLENKMDLLNRGTVPILNILRNPQYQSTIPANSLKDFHNLSAQLTDFTQTIAALSQVPVPDYKRLIANPNDQLFSSLLPNLYMKH